MRIRDFLLGALGFLILFVWLLFYMVISWVFTGEVFPDN